MKPTTQPVNLRVKPMRLALVAATWGVLLALPLFLAGGCNTIEGVGEDLSAGGEAISGASREVRNENN